MRFRRLLEPVHGPALVFARNLSRSRSDGDDLFQEALVRAFTRLGTLRDEAAFRGWLYRIVISVHRNRSRRAFWRRFVQLEATSTSDDPDATGDDYRTAGSSPERVEAARRARLALAKLPAVQRESIVLFEIEGWSVDEIAALHEVSTSAVKSRLARGRDRLRALFQQHEAELAIPVLVQEDTP